MTISQHHWYITTRWPVLGIIMDISSGIFFLAVWIHLGWKRWTDPGYWKRKQHLHDD